MNKEKLDILEKLFEDEINMTHLPTQISDTKLAKELLDENCIQKETAILDGKYPVKIEGYVLTHYGRWVYCDSCPDMGDI